MSRLITWCTQQSPSSRPSAKQILESGLLPGEINLSSKYLEVRASEDRSEATKRCEYLGWGAARSEATRALGNTM